MLTDAAYAKINLALHVRERMDDGYHRIETLFAFCEAGDRLSVAAADEISLEIDGPFASELSDGPDNLVLRAASDLRAAFGIEAGARLMLEKTLPVAAGIGGGSADAAAALRLLARHWRIEGKRIDDIARALGADVPACLVSRTIRGEERGDRLQPVEARALTGTPVLLVNPGVALATRDVFAGWNGRDRGPLAMGDPLAAAMLGRNDLETPAIARVPAIGALLGWFRDRTAATLARMSGSGATCFALFADDDARDRAHAAVSAAFPGYWSLATRLR